MRGLSAGLIVTFGVAVICFTVSTEPTRADQAFLCDGGKVVKVAQKDLDHFKRTNSCVARYFGLVAIESGMPPLPVRRVLPVKTRGSTFAAPRKGGARLAQVAPTGSETNSTPNFREVNIINAAPGASRIFHHRF